MSKLDNEKDRDNIEEKVSEWQKTLLNHRKQRMLGFLKDFIRRV
jgi:hypothetical protein